MRNGGRFAALQLTFDDCASHRFVAAVSPAALCGSTFAREFALQVSTVSVRIPFWLLRPPVGQTSRQAPITRQCADLASEGRVTRMAGGIRIADSLAR